MVFAFDPSLAAALGAAGGRRHLADASGYSGAGRSCGVISYLARRSTAFMRLIGHSPNWALRFNSSAERLLLALTGHFSTERTDAHINPLKAALKGSGKILEQLSSMKQPIKDLVKEITNEDS